MLNNNLKPIKMVTVVIRKFCLNNIVTLISTSLKIFGTIHEKLRTLITRFNL